MVNHKSAYPVHMRLAELRVKQKAQALTEDEQVEMNQCLDWHVNYCWQISLLLNYSLMASMTEDTKWQNEICKELDS